ncbi:MAG: nitrate/nitrite transporter NrtS [Chloroflexi bacterium]|nr:nitrate/nitrite transporter NrtS [Chloroflexota bacterium]MBI3732540.1 nitrate/nitrite transporter NrtS [Chloroflexota bacterium]
MVGTTLVLINQGTVLLGAHFSGDLILKIAVTYCVPYCVTMWGALSNSRVQAG